MVSVHTYKPTSHSPLKYYKLGVSIKKIGHIVNKAHIPTRIKYASFAVGTIKEAESSGWGGAFNAGFAREIYGDSHPHNTT